MAKDEKYSEMTIYFDLTNPEKIDNAEKFVMELNQSTWTDYLTGLMVALSLNKNRFGVRTSLEIPTIQKDNENYQTYSEFIKKSAVRHQADQIIDLDLLDSIKWQEEYNDFMSNSQISTIANFGTEETFEMFRQNIKSKSL